MLQNTVFEDISDIENKMIMSHYNLYEFINNIDEHRNESYKNITIRSVTVKEISTASLIELTGIPYLTTYSFQGLHASDVNLGKTDIYD